MACKKYTVHVYNASTPCQFTYKDCFGANQSGTATSDTDIYATEGTVQTTNGYAEDKGVYSTTQPANSCSLSLGTVVHSDTGEGRVLHVQMSDTYVGQFTYAAYQAGSIYLLKSGAIYPDNSVFNITFDSTTRGTIRVEFRNNLCTKEITYTFPDPSTTIICKTHKLTLPGRFRWKDCAGIDRDSANPTNADSGRAAGSSGEITVCGLPGSFSNVNGQVQLLGDCATGTPDCALSIQATTKTDGGDKWNLETTITGVSPNSTHLAISAYKSDQPIYADTIIYQNGKVSYSIPKVYGFIAVKAYDGSTNCLANQDYDLGSSSTPVGDQQCDLQIVNVVESTEDGKKILTSTISSNIANLSPIATKVIQNNQTIWEDGGQQMQTGGKVRVAVPIAATGIVYLEFKSLGSKQCTTSKYYTLNGTAPDQSIPVDYTCDVRIEKVEHDTRDNVRVIRPFIASNIPNLAPLEYAIYRNTDRIGYKADSYKNGDEVLIDRLNTGTVRIEVKTKGSKQCVAEYNYTLPDLATQQPVSGALTINEPKYNCNTGQFQFEVASDQVGKIEVRAAGVTDWTENKGPFIIPTDGRVGRVITMEARQGTSNAVQNYTTSCYRNYTFGQEASGTINVEAWYPGALNVRFKSKEYFNDATINFNELTNPVAWFSRIAVNNVQRVHLKMTRPNGSIMEWDDIAPVKPEGTEEERVVSFLPRNVGETLQQGVYIFLIEAKDSSNTIIKAKTIKLTINAGGTTEAGTTNKIALEAWIPGELGTRRKQLALTHLARYEKKQLPNPVQFFARVDVKDIKKLFFRGIRPDGTQAQWNESVGFNPTGTEEQQVASWGLRSTGEALQLGDYFFSIYAQREDGSNIFTSEIKFTVVADGTLPTVPNETSNIGTIDIEAWKTGALGVRAKVRTLVNNESVLKSALPDPINFFARINVPGQKRVYFECLRPNGTKTQWNENAETNPSGSEEQRVVSLLYRDGSEALQLGKYTFKVIAQDANSITMKEVNLTFTVTQSTTGGTGGTTTPTTTPLSMTVNAICAGTKFNVDIQTLGGTGDKRFGVSDASNVTPTSFQTSPIFSGISANTTKTFWVTAGSETITKTVALGNCGDSVLEIELEHNLPSDTYQLVVTDAQQCVDIETINL